MHCLRPECIAAGRYGRCPTDGHCLDPPEPPEPEPTIELTEIGEQYVIPGCERDQARGPKQGKLWD